jgi:DNA-binding transcriptional ArsR family regulator
MAHVDNGMAPELTDLTQHLLAICTELVQKNKAIKLDKLYNIARREMQAVESGAILQGIKRLEEDMLIKADSRLLRADLLQNETRREIYFTIRRNPGISFNQVRHAMGKGTKILLWHVEVLLEFGCIRSYSFDTNANAYFTKHVDEADWGQDGLLIFFFYQNATIKKILDVLQPNSQTIKNIEAILGISRQLIDYHLKRLEARGIVAATDDTPRRFFLPGPIAILFDQCKNYFESGA